MGTWSARYERASHPRSLSAIARSAIETCSPAASSTSSSRGSGRRCTPCASSTSRAVSAPMAETTTATSFPSERQATIRSAARWMSATEPTDVPPNFCTTITAISRSEVSVDPRRHGRERRVELLRLGAARLGEVGAAAALAPDLLRDDAHDLAGLQPIRVVARDAGREAHLAVLDGREHDDGRAQLRLQPIDGLAQELRVGILDAGREHLHALHIHRLLGQLVAAR